MSILLLATSSCDDFLNIEPESYLTPPFFFQNEDDINRAVAGIYQVNRSLFNSLMWQFGEMRSDNTSFYYNTGDRGGLAIEEIDWFLMNPDNGRVAEFWNVLYEGISRSNYVLLQIDDIDFTNEEVREYRRAEALFLRSWFYYLLVEFWGDVPQANALINSADDAYTPTFTERIPREEIYANIHADVQQAIEILPQWNSANTGRASRGAALMLKAKMYMAQQNFAAALPLLEEINTLGYRLLDNYQDVFDPENKNHQESIFEIQYSFEFNQPSNFITSFVPWNSGSDILGSDELGGFEQQTASPRGGFNQPTRDIIDLYRDEDVRKDFSISYYIIENDENDPADDDSVAYLSKYSFPFQDLGQQDVNWPMFRYADALLMLAECYNEVNGLDQNALGILNIIRLRAGVPPVLDIGTDPELVVRNQEELRAAIARERRLELAFENHRWLDLLRTKTDAELQQFMIEHGIEEKAIKDEVIPEAYTNIRTVLPVPANQVRNFDIEQTDVWK